jgi:hypothetical protein
MPRPFNRRQARENAAFLRILAETGNVELAARECGLHKPTLYSRRKVNAAFAAEWDAAITAARALMAGAPGVAARAGKGRWPDSARAPKRFKTSPSGAGGFKSAPSGAGYKTAGGEPRITRMKDGSLQLRLARAGGIGFRAEQAFLRALATCGNIAVAARAVGVAPRNIYKRADRCPVFKAEMDQARKVASERLEWVLRERVEHALAGAGANDLWYEKDLPPMPEVTFDQALMLLRLYHLREALGEEWGRYARRRRRGPLSSNEIAIERQIWWAAEREKRAGQERRRARGEARARHYEETGNWFLPGEEVPDALAEGREGARTGGKKADPGSSPG